MLNLGAGTLDYVRAVYRRRWLALPIFVAVVAGTATYVYRAVPIYEARATMLVEPEEPTVVTFKQVLEEDASDDLQTHQEVLQSRAVAERTVEAANLAALPDFADASPSAMLGYVRSGLRVSLVRGSRMVNIAFRSPDPELAADIANAHARAYIDQDLEHRFTASADATQWLATQLAEERKRVERAESDLQEFREKHDALSLKDGQDIVVQKLADLNAAVTRAKTNRIEKEARYRQVQAIEQDPVALSAFPAILSNSFVQQLKADVAVLQREFAQLSETLGERHPTLLEKKTALSTAEKRLAAEITRVLDAIRSEYQGALAEEVSLTRALDEQKREALTLNRRGIEYAALEREAESNRQVYQSLLQRAKETGVSRELRATNLRIVDLARPPAAPVFPRKTYSLIVSVILGLLLALGAVFVAELLDDRVKTPEDLTEQLGQPCLGIVPELRGRDRSAAIMLREPPPHFSEAVRGLRTSIVTSSREAPSRSLLVASASEGEGKTLVAGNLAIALAQTGQRVVLIDADLRKPRLHELLDQSLEPGLTDVLTGNATLADVLRTTAVPGLTLVAAGRPTEQASELLASAAFDQLFALLTEHFVWVVIDSPPVLSVTDANVVAARTNGVALVIGAGRTSARAARLALEELDRAGGHIVGAILSRVDLDRHPFYYAPYVKAGYDRPRTPRRGSRSLASIFGRSA